MGALFQEKIMNVRESDNFSLRTDKILV